MTEEAKRAIDFISELEPNHFDSYHSTEQTDRVSQSDHQVSYLLAAAGSGKTLRMFRMLKDHFGFYVVSGAVGFRKQPYDTGDHLYQPRASIKSGNTYLLFRTVELAQTYSYSDNVDGEIVPSTFEGRCLLLLMNRIRLSDQVSRLNVKETIKIRPWQWLRYQLSCNQDDDPFRRLLHCLFLGTGQRQALPRVLKRLPPKNRSQLLWYFDEVQCDLETIPSQSVTSHICANMSPLSTMIRTLTDITHIQNQTPRPSGIVLAGTALNLEGVEQAVQRGLDFTVSNIVGRRMPDVRPLQECRLVNEDKDFESLLEPTLHSLVEAIWDVRSQSQESCDPQQISRILGASLIGNETIFDDSSVVLKFHQL